MYHIKDSEFLRGKVPMTKEEVRAVSIAKLDMKDTDICLDIGAGTGSVSIEMARFASKGKVYAIEEKQEAVDLIKENTENDSEMSFSDILGDEDRSYTDIENYDFVKEFLDRLSETEKQIILGRFFENKTQVVIAGELDLSQMTISRIEKKVILKLKEEYQKLML